MTVSVIIDANDLACAPAQCCCQRHGERRNTACPALRLTGCPSCRRCGYRSYTVGSVYQLQHHNGSKGVRPIYQPKYDSSNKHTGSSVSHTTTMATRGQADLPAAAPQWQQQVPAMARAGRHLVMLGWASRLPDAKPVTGGGSDRNGAGQQHDVLLRTDALLCSSDVELCTNVCFGRRV
jgi:hypothetical protein